VFKKFIAGIVLLCAFLILCLLWKVILGLLAIAAIFGAAIFLSMTLEWAVKTLRR
jgi:Kef-type K+ transport system membrane component KefB